MKILRCLALAHLVPALLTAQSSLPFRRVQVGVEATHFHLNAGATTRWGGLARVAVRPSLRQPGVLVEGALLYTGESESRFIPGLVGAQIGLLLLIPPPKRPDWPNVGISFGYTRLHYDASEYERVSESCIPQDGCMFEVEGYNSGWKSAAHVGAALEFPVGNRVAIRVAGTLLFLVADRAPANGHRHARLSFGGAWWL